MLIDGLDQLSTLGSDPPGSRLKWMGLDPATAIGPTSPLLVRPKPHDSFVARCSCTSLGCAALTARIRLRDGHVVWDRFRTGYKADGDELNIDPFVFDADEYRHSILGVGSPASTWQPTTRDAVRQINRQLEQYSDEPNRLTMRRAMHLDDERITIRMGFGELADDDRAILTRVLVLRHEETADDLAARAAEYIKSGQILEDQRATSSYY